MTKKSTRKNTEASEKSQPMDPSIREEKTPQISENHKRVCYAAKQLVAEVGDLFPEVPVSYHDVDGRSTALSVIFDLEGLSASESGDLSDLLSAIVADVRVEFLQVAGSQHRVKFKSSARTQDDRSEFRLSDAYLAMMDYDESAEEDALEDDDLYTKTDWEGSL